MLVASPMVMRSLPRQKTHKGLGADAAEAERATPSSSPQSVRPPAGRYSYIHTRRETVSLLACPLRAQKDREARETLRFGDLLELDDIGVE
jgi:hypothetical protein